MIRGAVQRLITTSNTGWPGRSQPTMPSEGGRGLMGVSGGLLGSGLAVPPWFPPPGVPLSPGLVPPGL